MRQDIRHHRGQVERGMVVVYDTFKRAWVDNCYPDLDEFWLCDECGSPELLCHFFCRLLVWQPQSVGHIETEDGWIPKFARSCKICSLG